jgi:hypothetical protein
VNVAIVGQPYEFNSFIAEELAELVGRGFKVTMPPQPFASVWYPAATIFLVVTLPETKVRWLPEQEIAVPELIPGTAHTAHFHKNFQVFTALVGGGERVNYLRLKSGACLVYLFSSPSTPAPSSCCGRLVGRF